jgi:predicted hydrocarbon binding protein
MLRDFIDALQTKLGPAGNAVIEEAAYVVGAKFAEELLERGLQRQEVPTILELLFNQAGWGKTVFHRNEQNQTIEVSIDNCATARHTNRATPNCYFLSGYFTGVFEKTYCTKMICTETACVTKGDKACTFTVTPR